MNIDKKSKELISDIEYIIGSQCYNPDSYNGYTGEEGLEYRYPASYRKNKKDKNLYKADSDIKELSEKQIRTVQYVFGANQLFIGEGIIKVLEELEKRYDIDFNELEKKRIKRRKASMRGVKRTLSKESEIELEAGQYECGLDIEEGKYRITSDEKAFIKIRRTDGSKRRKNFMIIECNSIERIELDQGDILESNERFVLKR